MILQILPSLGSSVPKIVVLTKSTSLIDDITHALPKEIAFEHPIPNLYRRTD